jgi:hypothetical protein
MSLRSRLVVSVLISIAAACGSDDGGGTGSSTTSDPSSTSEAASDGTTTMEATSEPTTTTDDPTTTGTTDDPSEGESTGACIPGSEGCSCDASSCDDGLTCVAEICQPIGGCDEEVDDEPNDDEDSAVDLGEVACDVSGDAQGTIAAGDVDWFTFHGTQTETCTMSSVAIVSADVDLNVCMYFECDMGNTQVVCPANATSDTTSGGAPGCCRTGNVAFATQSCLGATESDSGTVWLRVDGDAQTQCVDYALAYRFF